MKRLSTLLSMDRQLHAIAGTELIKLRRSPVVWITFLAYGIMVGVAGLFMWMLANPGAAADLGLISQKANLMVGGMQAAWQTYLFFSLEMAGLGGLIFLSLILTFVFGREYAEGTAKNLLALPAPRPLFVLAKLAVSAAWFAALTAFALLATWLVGVLLCLPGWSAELFRAHAAKVAIAALLDLSLGPFVAWATVRSRGYFAPLGLTIGTLLAATAVGATDWGRWFPWSIVLWYTGAGGPDKELAPGSFVVIVLFGLAMVVAAVGRELRADNAQ